MKFKYILFALFFVFIAFAGFRYVKQQGSKQVIYPPSSLPLGCARTTWPIETNILGIGQPAGLTMKDLSYLLDLGVKWVRTDFYWSDMEAREGVYHWNEVDSVVRVLNENNIKLLLSITYIPDWVWAKDKQGRQDAMYAFAKELAARNRGKVRYYEVFNEPNLPGIGFFRERDRVDVGTYLDFLASANKGIHEADPTAVVVLAGLSGVSDSKTFMDASTFIKQLYELGGKDCFDVLAYHPYESFGTIGKFKEKTDALRAITALYGDSSKPIWFNELGTTEESVRVDYLNQMKNEASVVPAWFWFSLHDFSKVDTFGLLTADYQKKPAYELFKQILKLRQ